MKDRLKEVRKAQLMTQPEFATATGKTRDSVSNYELGRVVPDDAYLKLLSVMYGYSFNWLKFGELPKKNPEGLGKIIGRISRDASGNREEVAQFFERISNRVKTDEELEAEILLMYTIMKRRFGPLLDGPKEPEKE